LIFADANKFIYLDPGVKPQDDKEKECPQDDKEKECHVMIILIAPE